MSRPAAPRSYSAGHGAPLRKQLAPLPLNRTASVERQEKALVWNDGLRLRPAVTCVMRLCQSWSAAL
jgi:hypothetical protein